MAQGKGNARGWGARDTLFVGLIVAFGILAAAVGVALAAPASPIFELEGDRDARAPSMSVGSGPSRAGKAITGSIGSPFPTGCR